MTTSSRYVKYITIATVRIRFSQIFSLFKYFVACWVDFLQTILWKKLKDFTFYSSHNLIALAKYYFILMNLKWYRTPYMIMIFMKPSTNIVQLIPLGSGVRP